ILVSSPSHGTLTLNASGSFTYTPAANYHGPDSFTYKANDGTADSNVATVSITVTSVNDAPVANDFETTVSRSVQSSFTFSWQPHASDADGNLPKTGSIVVLQPLRGTLVDNGDGTFTYTPFDDGFIGDDAFLFQVQDSGGLLSNVATVTIHITA